MPIRDRFRVILILFGTVVFLGAALLGCTQFTSPSPLPPTPSPTEAPLNTLAPTLVSGVVRHPVILSLEEQGYAHLFLFAPDTLTFTRLTYGQWNDITPAVSPDGKRIAFASNRNGFYDLYALDLSTGEVAQITDTPAYDASPTWSPDLAWLAFETYQNGNLDIALQSLADPAQAPILLTDDAAAEHSPAWAPNGREIAFVSDANGSADIWLADLNKTDNRFTDLTNTPQAAEAHPAWSPDGSRLAWSASSQTSDYDGIYVWDAARPENPADWVGSGDWPAWNAAGDAIVTVVNAADQQLLAAYTLAGQPILLPAPLPGQARGLLWPGALLPDPLPAPFLAAAAATPEVLAQAPVTPVPGVPAKRWYVVPLKDVDAPYAQIHALAEQPFAALRQRVISETGWDVLASLENAYVPLTTALDPGLQQDWLYTGRAFAINSLMVNAGWMAVEREDVGAQTYWRLYIRTKNQDGTQGEPLHNPPWDLNARYALDPSKYEAGGDYAVVPSGYWIDFTSLAATYGWKRLPALPNWRNYYTGARFTEFALTGGLDWYAAMLELYPEAALLTPTPVLPPTATPSRTPVPTKTPGPSPTASKTPLPTATRTATSTPLPSSTPPATSTPPTIIPTFPSPTP